MLTPHLVLLPADRVIGIDTFGRLPVVIADGGDVRAVGKGMTAAQRQGSARGEWLERSILYGSVPERYASVRELGVSCLPPPLFGLDLPEERPDLVVGYDEDQAVGWIPVRSLSGESRWLHQPGWREAGFQRPTSNGAAIGESDGDALAAAVAELLERHAFVTWWYELEAAMPIPVGSADWQALTRWFVRHGWDLTAYLLPVCAPLPVVLAAAFRDGQAAVIGLGTGADGPDPVECAAVRAALEIVQALETFAIVRAGGHPVKGDLAEFLTPAGAHAIRSRLRPGRQALPYADDQWLSCPIAAVQRSGIEIWSSSRPVGPRTHFVQVFSPDTLPFPSTGRGRRLDHPVLRRHLAASGREFTSVPPLPHPLG